MILLKLREKLRLLLITMRYFVLKHIFKMDIAKTARISFGAKLDRTNPTGVHIGEESYVASGAYVLSHDFCRAIRTDTYIGKRVFIGMNSIVMPGVTIGDEVVVGAGSIVTKSVPSNCIVAGNPAKIIKEGIHTVRYGQLHPDSK